MRNVKTLLIMTILLLSFPVPSLSSSSTKNTHKIINITFSHPLSLSELNSFSEKGVGRVAMIRSQFRVGDTIHQEFFVLPNSTENKLVGTSKLKQDFHRHRLSLMKAVLESSNNLQASTVKNRESTYRAMRDVVSEMKTGDVLIDKVTIIADERKINMLNNPRMSMIQSIEISDASQHNKKLYSKMEMTKSQPTNKGYSTVNQVSTWWPNVGHSVTGEHSSTERYTLQYMGWDNPDFSSIQTYEHDFFLYNYDGSTYLDSNSTIYPGCFPVGTYAATTWPSASRTYLDTRFDFTECESDEVPYTIGAAQADAIPGGILHYNYLVTENGNIGSGRFKLQAQRGERIPSGCYTTWCSFSDSLITLVPSWNPLVPGTFSWTK